MERILISGATGLVGKQLCKLLYQEGYEINILSRSAGKNKNYHYYKWDLEASYIDEAVFEKKIDYVIHLAGAGIADKLWTKKRKAEIISSRVGGIDLLYKSLQKLPYKPKAFLSASAIGIYGNRPDNNVLDEFSQINKDSKEFLVQSCLDWEAASDKIEALGIRTIKFRIGIVLSTQGGAMVKMMMSRQLRIFPYFGDGKQVYSWIHIEDLCRLVLHLVRKQDSNGIYNAVSPYPISNKDMMMNISKASGLKSIFFPVPKLALQMAMGEMSSVVLDSANIYPKRILEEGFVFNFPDNTAAIEDLLKRKI
jgi:uncharacterized protein (TIGR01777 family)